MINYWDDLRPAFQSLSDCPTDWHVREYDLFFEVEATLHLCEILIQAEAQRDARSAWGIISGYCVSNLNAHTPQRQMCVCLRHNLRYVKTPTAWHFWLNWYRRQPQSVRLYRFELSSPKTLIFRQQMHTAPLRERRLAAYEDLFAERVSSVVEPLPFAGADDYTFHVDDRIYRVTISPEMASFARQPAPTRTVSMRTQLPPLEIDLDAVSQMAEELDQREQRLGYDRPRRWVEAIRNLRLALVQEGGLEETRVFRLDGLLHLVGMLGTGKSTLIWALTYYLARHGYHVTVVVNTIVESVQMASWLRQMGVLATPALGKDRPAHEKRVALADEERLRVEHLYRDELPPPVLMWMPSPCAISGAQADPLPQANLPCYSLNGDDGKKYACPLLPVCPMHQASRDLVDSSVWVINPFSFLYTRAPAGIAPTNMRLFEAIYHRSDVVIVDEADRVQVQWDREFAPSQLLAGSQNALLDELHQQLGNRFVGEAGRREAAATSQFHRLNSLEAQVHQLSSQLFRLLRTQPRVMKWIARHFLTNENVFYRLKAELLKQEKDEAARVELDERLGEAFRTYWRNPLSRESGALAEWIGEMFARDPNERAHLKSLETWLRQQMGWRKSRLSKQQREFVYKLQFALIFAALLKRTNNINHQLRWFYDEPDLPELFANAVPQATAAFALPPPIGEMLGVQYLDDADGKNLGVFEILRYTGIGRWVLLNFHRALIDLNGAVGPHVLLTSATSWLPGAAQFHIAQPPQLALLPLANNTDTEIELASHYIDKGSGPLMVSGAKHPEANLREMIVALTEAQGQNPSTLHAELKFWQERGTRRRILLVVGSYAQTDVVLSELDKQGWAGRAVRLLPDDAEAQHERILRTRQSEQFYRLDADILIAPLLAIQRGFNILDEQASKALLGSVFFLVRSYPQPSDLSAQIMGMNQWTMNQLVDGMRTLHPDFATDSEAMRVFRRAAQRQWHQRLSQGRYGVASLSPEQYNEYMRDQFVVIWQTIGRLLRNESSARVFFVDYGFGRPYGSYHLLRDWSLMLDDLANRGSAGERALAQALYGPAQRAFAEALRTKRIY
jgi:hypothetical protein